MGNEQTKVASLSGNVFLFNKIKNNNKDIELLRETFESLDCIVTEIQNGTYDEFIAIGRAIVRADFSNFKYIVIIILDNTNEDEGMWITTDNKVFHTNGDLLTEIYANRTLEGKLRFTILQTNRDTKNENIKKRTLKPKCYPALDLRYCATSPGCDLIHEWTPDEPSPFIYNLCKEINENRHSATPKPITEVLDCASRNITAVTKELPCKERNFSKPFILSGARI